MVDLAVNEAPLAPPREMVYGRFPMVDGAGNERGVLRAAVETTASLLRARVSTLVFCSAGMSRSPAVAAAALAMVTGRSAGDWLAEIAKGGGVDVSWAFWGEVLEAARGSHTRTHELGG